MADDDSICNGKPVLSIKNLSVKFGQRAALDNISFDVMPGEVFALIGSNGAGKSTLLSCLCRKLKDYTGIIEICGKNIRTYPGVIVSSVSIVPQDYVFFQDFTVEENIRFACETFDIQGKEADTTIARLLDEFSLTRFSGTPARLLSGGYKRLLTIAMAVVRTPQLILLDEPAAALDVDMRRLLNEIIESFRNKGITVILTTHYLEDAEHLCDRAVLLHIGKAMAVGPIDKMIEEKGGPYKFILSEFRGNVDKLKGIINSSSNFESIDAGEKGDLILTASQKKLPECLAELGDIFEIKGLTVGKIQIVEPSLNEVLIGMRREESK